MKADELLASIIADHEVILPRGLVMANGQRIGIDFGGLGEFHMKTDTIARGNQYVPIHVDGNSIEEVRAKFAAEILVAARELSDG